MNAPHHSRRGGLVTCAQRPTQGGHKTRQEAAPGVRRAARRTAMALLCLALIALGDWTFPDQSQARRGVASGPRGTVAYSPRGAVAVGSRGGAAVAGPRGAAAVGPGGSAAVVGPYGGVARGPAGNVVAAPRGRVVAPPVAVPVPVPVPVAPAYYGPGYYGPSASGVAAGVAIGAMLTALPAAAVALSKSSGTTVYMVDSTCYKEVRKDSKIYYQQIPCP